MNLILIIPILVSFLVTFLSLPFWIKKCRSGGLLWEDMNKYGNPKVGAASGGIVVVVGFILGIFTYIAIRTFIMQDADGINVQIFSLVSVVLLTAIVGLTDDFLGWHNNGLSMKVRLILAFLASIPLVVINAGQDSMTFPIIGTVALGLIYPLFFIPLGVAATSTVFNFLAGFDGLESGLGILIFSFLSFVSYINGHPWLALIGLCLVASLVAFWFYNKNPAQVFPGDVMTYAVGSMIAIMAILGNFERVALIIFIPYIIEMILKVRGGLKGKRKQSFGIPQKDGSLEMPYEKIYGLTHFSIWFLKKFKKKVYKNDVVYFIYIIEILFILLAFLTI